MENIKQILHFGRVTRRWGLMLLLLSLLCLEICQIGIFLIVPTEKVMGAIQRIFYFHVGSAIACYVSFGVVLVASLCVLATRNRFYDICNVAAAEVAFLMCTITLASGSIWAKTAWNTWFRWEPRLVTFLLLWLIAASLLFLRRFGDEAKMETATACLGILAALTVPLVWLSVHLIPQVAQLHPQVVEKGGLKDVRFILFFVCSCIAFSLFSFALMWLRVRIGCVREVLGLVAYGQLERSGE